MEPNYKKAALKANETYTKHGSDPLHIMNKLPKVRVFQFGINDIHHENCEAFTFVRNKDGILQYIVMYNNNLPSYIINRALARELSHIILEHDGNVPEEVWSEEANCFAYHYICPFIRKKKIQYRPKHNNLLWEMKSICAFDSVDHLKKYVVDEVNKFNRFIGKTNQYQIEDVKVSDRSYFDCVSGWKNCREVVLDGNTVGYCGE